MLYFILGLVVGTLLGIVIMCLMIIARDADTHMEQYEHNRREENTNDSQK